MRAIFAVFLLGGLPASVEAQRQDPIQWSLEAAAGEVPPSAVLPLKLTAKLEPGWHLYSLTTPEGGPIRTTVRLADNSALTGWRIFQPKPVSRLDPNFGVATETYEGQQVVFLLDAQLAPAAQSPVEIIAQVRYQACTDKLCLPPRRKAASVTVNMAASAAAPSRPIPPEYAEVRLAEPAPATGARAPVRMGDGQTQGLGGFLLIAFGFGLAAIFTPCVFPMIPITMSYFLNQGGGGERGSAVARASVFALGIIVLFTLLGTLTTAALGPFGVVQLGSNPWVNGFITVVFAAFALSLLGAFEITLPSGFLTRLNQASGRGGVAGTLLMGLTFSLTSFACVGPFVGTLLAASVQGGRLQPVLGMASFSAGLSAPFFLLALFPAWLGRLPRSGGWMSRVKIVLGFVILAAALKYLSNIDQVFQWNFLTRERFLAAWVVLFTLPGLYLLGFLRMEGIKPEETLGVRRLLIGASFIVFAVSLLPGMFGARLGELDAYVPAAQGTNVSKWLKNQYVEALARARQENKLVFVSFTGYACTNCHWMKANMFPRPEIAAALGNYVLLELYTDGSDTRSESNQKFQEQRFNTVAIPFYAIVDADEKVVAAFAGLTRDPREFLKFLEQGVRK